MVNVDDNTSIFTDKIILVIKINSRINKSKKY